MEEKVIVVATDLEESLVKPLTKLKIIKTQPGSSNVIETLKNLDIKTKIINVGYAGSNILPVGSIAKVKKVIFITQM